MTKSTPRAWLWYKYGCFPREFGKISFSTNHGYSPTDQDHRLIIFHLAPNSINLLVNLSSLLRFNMTGRE